MNTNIILVWKYGKAVLTIAEAGIELNWKPKTIRNRLANGTFPFPSIKLGGHTCFRVQDLGEYIDSQAEHAKKCTKWAPGRRS